MLLFGFGHSAPDLNVLFASNHERMETHPGYQINTFAERHSDVDRNRQALLAQTKNRSGP